MIFLARGGLSRRQRLYRRIHRRLGDQPEFDRVRYAPSAIRPRRVVADVDPTIFVGEAYPADTARLEIEFDPRIERDHYWIEWIEPEHGFACGWHQDATHDELGECHWQIDRRSDDGPERETASFVDEHPLAVFERRMAELPEKLRTASVSEERANTRHDENDED